MELFDKVVGAVWGGFLAYDLANLAGAKNAYSEAKALSETKEKIVALRNQLFLAVVRAASSLSYTLAWMQKVQWIDLGRLLPILGPIGLGVRTLMFAAEGRESFQKIFSETDKVERTKATLWFVYNAASVSYYVATLLSLVIETSALVVACEAASMLLFISLIALISYYAFLEVQKRVQPFSVKTGASLA